MKNQINQLNNFDFGKLPPQAIDMEEVVLGALMLEKDSIYKIMDFLKPEAFYKESHQKIYSAIIELTINSNPVDILTVAKQLKKTNELDNIGGLGYIKELTDRVASAAHIEFHARIIMQQFLRREIIRISTEIQNKAFDESIDIDELIDFSENEIFQLTQDSFKKEAVHIKEIIKENLQRIEDIQTKKLELTGLPSGISRIDRITNGWQKSDFIIIAARTSMGKTAFAILNFLSANKPTCLFSLEMSCPQIGNRIMAFESDLTPTQLRDGKLESHQWEQLDNNLKKIINKELYIDDTPAMSLMELRAKAKRLKMKYDIQLIIVDYIQLMINRTEQNKFNREQEISSISRGLKSIAKEMDIPVIALSQMNRSVEIRGNKRPQLSDLRESGAIEQDADLVLFLHRPEKYGFLEDEEGNSLEGIIEIIIAKHRNGALKDIPVRINESLTKWDIEIPFEYKEFNFKKEPKNYYEKDEPF